MSSAWAQEGNPAPHTHAENEASPQQDSSMAGMNMHREESSGPQLPSPHAGLRNCMAAGFGASIRMDVDAQRVELMAHGVIFVDYNQQGGPRGAGKAESVNWA